jgi:hypothetical protein
MITKHVLKYYYKNIISIVNLWLYEQSVFN